MGAKQGRTKGNEQKAEYLESNGRHGKPGWKEEEKQESESRPGKLRKPSCMAETADGRKGKKQRLSS